MLAFSRRSTLAACVAWFGLSASACGGEALRYETSGPVGETQCRADALPAAGGGASSEHLVPPGAILPAEPRVVVMGDLHSDVDAARAQIAIAM